MNYTIKKSPKGYIIFRNTLGGVPCTQITMNAFDSIETAQAEIAHVARLEHKAPTVSIDLRGN